METRRMSEAINVRHVSFRQVLSSALTQFIDNSEVEDTEHASDLAEAQRMLDMVNGALAGVRTLLMEGS
jgi:hypothetical protein